MIGAGAAEYLSTLGANLVLTGRNEENLLKTVGNCKGKGVVLPVVSDVTVEADRENVVAKAIQKFGKIDVLVNNAGIGGRGGVLNTNMDKFDLLMNTNVRSVFQLTQLVAPHLIKSKGCIVNVSSVVGLRAFADSSYYCMSKAALDQFTKCVALELAPHGVRVNSINPGLIVTEFQKRIGLDEAGYQEFLARVGAGHPLGRAGNVDETAKAIAFLACNEVSSFITATLLPVDGGKNNQCQR